MVVTNHSQSLVRLGSTSSDGELAPMSSTLEPANRKGFAIDEDGFKTHKIGFSTMGKVKSNKRETLY